MNFRKAILMGSVSALAITCSAVSAFAQTEAAPEEIVVTGIRASLQQSLSAKKESDDIVEVVSAEDIGKMPDKNVADALQRVPGVNISPSPASGSGGFGENDRVSLRGSTPSLTYVTVDGHTISTGDWFVLDQVQAPGRSISLSVLPSEIVNKITVYKGQEADLPEGGTAGTIDIVTRKPLDLKQSFTASIMIGGAYQTLAASADPQANALLGWKNDAKTFGVIVQGFYEKRDLRRDGEEVLGYQTITSTSAFGKADPAVVGDLLPQGINNALFQQTRDRQGGLIDIQYKPINNLTIDLNAFYSHVNDTNLNQSTILGVGYAFGPNVAPTSYSTTGNVVTGATFPSPASVGYGTNALIEDVLPRVNNYSQTFYVDMPIKLKVNSRLTLDTDVGYTRGIGKTVGASSGEYEMNTNQTGASFQMNGTAAPITQNITNPAVLTAQGVNTLWDWDWGTRSYATATDNEYWAKADAEYFIGQDILDSLKAGVRWTDHTREVLPSGAGTSGGLNTGSQATTANPNGSRGPVYTGGFYPSNFGSGLGTQMLLGPTFSASAINNWAALYMAHVPASRVEAQSQTDVNEKDLAGYVKATFNGGDWKGNAGVRFVETKENAGINVATASGNLVSAYLSTYNWGAGLPGTDPNGNYSHEHVIHDYFDILPSANISEELSKNLYLKGSIDRSMTRPDYYAEGGAVSLNDPRTLGAIGTGTGGNPDLKPIRAWTEDLELSYYFGPQSIVSAGVFHTNFLSAVDYYVLPGVSFFNATLHTASLYDITSFTNVHAESKGVELNYEQPVVHGFGVLGNYTYALAKEDNGDAMQGASRNTYNLGAYYEDKLISARVTYTYRSHYLVAEDRGTPYNALGIGTLDGALVVTMTPQVSLEFDALHLTDEREAYYAFDTNQPRAFYDNGRTFYASLRYKY